MKKLLFLLIISIFVLSGCQKELEVAQPEKQFMEIGNPFGAFIFSNLPKPDTVFKHKVHVTIRQLDLNGDNSPEIMIFSSQDTLDGVTVVKELKVLKNPASPYTTYIGVESSNPPFFIKAYSDGSYIDLNQISRIKLKTEHTLASYSYNYETKEEYIGGNWNGRKERSFVVMFESEGISFASWVKITVTEFDNYIFYNYASYANESIPN